MLGNPAVLGEAPAAGSAARIAADGGRTFIAARSSGLLVFEVSELASRRIIRPAGTLGARFAEDVAAAGSLAFIADGAAGLRIVAVEPGGSGGGSTGRASSRSSSPAASSTGSRFPGRSPASLPERAGVLVLDVADPAVPRQLAAIPSVDARDVALEGTRLLVADAVAGLRVFDLCDPGEPRGESAVARPGGQSVSGEGLGARGVQRRGDRDRLGGRRLPRIAAHYRTEWAEDACRDGDRLLVAEGHRGLTVIDLADPSRPRVVSVRRDLYASAVSAGEGCVLVAGAGSVWAVKILVPPWLER